VPEPPDDPEFSVSDYRRLADFRSAIRQFLHFSEEAARQNGFEPQQHQLLLAVKGLPEGVRPTITALSARLCLKHHSTVELINRMVCRGFVVRRPSEEDRREALIDLTPQGEEALRKLSILHWQELQKWESALSETLQHIVKQS
jgi:DNA-binding MarR family transcriptional regulator